jgi:hypothetical protein
MLKPKYVFTFIFITFLLLSITGAGIFLDDEWASAQQLRQLGEGHQITINDGGYGYYSNGTSGNYFIYRSNRLMYSLALPISALPIYEIAKLSGEHFRMFFLFIWTLFGLLILLFLRFTSRLSFRYFTIGICSLIILTSINIFLYKDFPINGEFAPLEVLVIVFTNIILCGLFASILHKIIDDLFDNDRLKIFTFIATMSCTSILFWAGTCKDHILSAFIGLLILYYLIHYEKNKSMSSLSIALFLTGLLTWVRIEYGVGMLLGIGLYLLIYHYKNILSNIIILSGSFLVGTLPLWINNYITTGSPFIHPFSLSFSGVSAGVSYEESQTISLMLNDLKSNIFLALFKILFSPGNGATGILIIIPLLIIGLVAYLLKRVKLSNMDIMLLIISFASVIYYIVIGYATMSADPGIVPDMRYFVAFYTPITLFIISLLSKIIPDLKFKKMILYYILSTGLMVILLTSYCTTISDGGYRDLNKIVNTLVTIFMGIGIIAVINDIRLKKSYLTYILPILISIPMAWQLTMIFIYHTAKVQSYPMFIPITEFIYNYLFSLIY